MMKKIATFIFGLLAGFTVLWLNQKVDFGGAFAKLTINRQTADFFENILNDQLKSEFAVVALYTFSKSLILCTPLGMLLGLIATKIHHKRTLIYSILIWPVQNLSMIFLSQLLLAGTEVDFLINTNYRGNIYKIQSAFISFTTLYIAIFIAYLAINRKQPNKLINRP